ncbi:hypothetical protein IFR05_001160 [Cadophora sp. M221]|nr:hypothetical protein IFR05_001160 [Cadophora sp. M221]
MLRRPYSDWKTLIVSAISGDVATRTHDGGHDSNAQSDGTTQTEEAAPDIVYGCKPRADGPCEHCLRRYPPVECFVDVNAHRREGRPNQASRSAATAVNFKLLETGSAVPGVDQSNPLPGAPETRYSGTSAPAYTKGFGNESEILLADDTKQREYRPSSQDTKPVLPSSNGSVASVPSTSQFEIFHTRTELVTYGYRVAHHGSTPSSQVMGGIITAVNNSLTNVPIEPTLRNAELFHFCESFEPSTGLRSDVPLVHQRVTASMTSIDGSKTPQMFLQAILPWMLQSHLMPHIAILMASSKQSVENNVGGEKKSETSLVKSKVLGLFNNFLENDFRVVGNAAIKAIVPLIITEVAIHFQTPETAH